MAARCRTLDWRATPLGAPDAWPLSLRTLVRTLLASRHPMVLFWGPDLVQIYNDAYRASLGEGGAHPAALGARGRETWADIWELIGPPIEEVMASGTTTWHENRVIPIPRNGRVDDVSWTCSLGPAFDDDGRVQGVLAICQETTTQVAAEQRSRQLAQRLSTVFESITDAFFMMDRDWRFTFLNTEAERLLERSRTALLGRVVWDEFPEAIASVFEHEYRRAVRERAAVHFEAYYGPLERLFSVTAYPSDEGLAVYFRDETERRAIEDRLRAREHVLGIAGRVARLGGWIVDLASGTCLFSDEVCDIHELPHGSSPSLDDALAFYDERWRPVITACFARCASAGEPYDVPLQIVTTSGRRVWVRAIGEAVRDASGAITAVQGALQDIEQQKLVEEALQESERRFRQLAESMPHIVWSADASGAVDFQTANMQTMSGLTVAELSGDGWLRAIHPDDLAAVGDAWSHALATGDLYQVQFRIRRADGAWRWHLTRALPFRDRDGVIVRWFGSSTDIHDQLELQQEAESLARRLATTLENLTDAFCLLRPDWTFTFVNSEAERILDCRAADVLGMRIWDALPALAGSRLEQEFRRAVDAGTTVAFRYHYPALARWVDVRAYPSTEGLAVYIRDVTAERRVELQLQEQAALLDRARDAIIVRSLDHTLLYWNEGAERVYGWSRDEVLGRPVVDLLYVDPTPYHAAVAAVLQRGEWTGELSHHRKDGASITVEGRWSLLYDDQGQPARILAINTDVTERKQLLQQFLRAQRMESIGTLAGGIAHDLNNVLAPILLSVDVLKATASDPEVVDTLTMIETSAQRGADMVRQVLGFARGFERSDVTIDLRRIIDDVVRVVRDTFPKDIVVVTHVADGLLPIVGDPTQLHQVLMNLVVNARDAMPRGGMLTVSAAVVALDDHYAAIAPDARPGPYVLVSVADTGTGMPPEIVGQIFDPFFTTKDVGKGTGLGLSTVAAIVRSHRGFVYVYSEPGYGSTFRVYVPATLDGAAHDESAGDTERYRGAGELILVVDDEAAVREASRRTLETFGYRVVTAVDGTDAVALYARLAGEIDVVLTDMVMPLMDGAATVRALSRLNPAVRIIAASGLGAGAPLAGVAEGTVRQFLPKPYTAETLLRVIHDVLADH